MPNDVTQDRTEYLEGEVQRLQGEVDRLCGDARREEQEALRSILGVLRRECERLPADSPWLRRFLVMGFDLALEVAGESATVEEFSAVADAIAERRRGQ